MLGQKQLLQQGRQLRAPQQRSQQMLQPRQLLLRLQMAVHQPQRQRRGPKVNCQQAVPQQMPAHALLQQRLATLQLRELPLPVS